MLGSVNLASKVSLASQPSNSSKTRMPCSMYAAAADRKSPYEVLRVKRNASQIEIKTAYRTLAKLYHPDATAKFLNSSSFDGRDFVEIHEAYATLSDPDARAAYDSNLTVDSWRRRRNTATGVSDLMNQGYGKFYPTGRWETDQCW